MGTILTRRPLPPPRRRLESYLYHTSSSFDMSEQFDYVVVGGGIAGEYSRCGDIKLMMRLRHCESTFRSWT